MPDLLSLPRELRDEIYGWLFRSSLGTRASRSPRLRILKGKLSARGPTGRTQFSDEQPPRSVSNSENLRATRSAVTEDEPRSTAQDTLEFQYHVSEENIRYPSTSPLPATDSILHTNRQLRAEMQESIHRL